MKSLLPNFLWSYLIWITSTTTVYVLLQVQCTHMLRLRKRRRKKWKKIDRYKNIFDRNRFRTSLILWENRGSCQDWKTITLHFLFKCNILIKTERVYDILLWHQNPKYKSLFRLQWNTNIGRLFENWHQILCKAYELFYLC